MTTQPTPEAAQPEYNPYHLGREAALKAIKALLLRGPMAASKYSNGFNEVIRAALAVSPLEAQPVCERCQKQVPSVVLVETGFAGEKEPLCGACVSYEMAELERCCADIEEVRQAKLKQEAQGKPERTPPLTLQDIFAALSVCEIEHGDKQAENLTRQLNQALAVAAPSAGEQAAPSLDDLISKLDFDGDITAAIRTTNIQGLSMEETGRFWAAVDKRIRREQAAGQREAIAKALYDHERAEEAKDGHVGADYYAPWPSDSQRQPYCQWAYRAADAVVRALRGAGQPEGIQSNQKGGQQHD